MTVVNLPVGIGHQEGQFGLRLEVVGSEKTSWIFREWLKDPESHAPGGMQIFDRAVKSSGEEIKLWELRDTGLDSGQSLQDFAKARQSGRQRLG